MLSNDPENITFKLAADFINKSNLPVFLTGKAGTGKTTFLKYIKENTIKNTAIVAPTGVAAMNAGGTTIHSFFQLPFTPFIPENKNHFTQQNLNDKHNLLSHLRLNAERKELLQQLDLLIIDEISMVRADILDAIDTVLRYVRNRPGIPFGGVQVLYIGDMYQLPPVIKPDEWNVLSNSYSGPFFFCSQVIAEQPPVYIELNKVYRQRDENFIRLLNQVRNNEMDEDGYGLLHSRYQDDFIPPPEDKIIVLTTHNAKADTINALAIAKINKRQWDFKAIIEGVFFENSFPADETLQIKEGAQVMFIKNDIEKIRRYYNGKIGIVHKVENENIWVECITEGTRQLIEIKKETWRNIKYSLNNKTGRVEEEELGSFMQYPLRLAWAITIHKSQGLTFEKVIIDAGKAFAPGQVYVALSRCTTLDGLHLVSKISYNSLQSDPRIVAFAQNQQTVSEQSLVLKEAIHKYEYDIVDSIFNFNEPDKQFVDFSSWLIEPIHFGNQLSVWLNDVGLIWKRIIVPANTFHAQLAQIRMDLPAGNDHYQNRIKAAAAYFVKELLTLSEIIQRSPALTDNRQLAKEHDDKLQQLFDNISRKIHYINGCINGHSLEYYQKQKSSFTKKNIPHSAYSGKSSYVPANIQHPELYNLLKSKRDDLCSELNLPVYMICSSASIEEMTIALPTTLHALENINGFGKVKLKQFGKAFLDIIAAFCEEHDLDSKPGLLPAKKIRIKKAARKEDTKSQSFILYEQGKNIIEIAQERKLTVSTIEGHLAHYIAGGKIKIEKLIGSPKLAIMKNAKLLLKTESITLLKESYPAISFGEWRMFIAAEKHNALQN